MRQHIIITSDKQPWTSIKILMNQSYIVVHWNTGAIAMMVIIKRQCCLLLPMVMISTIIISFVLFFITISSIAWISISLYEEISHKYSRGNHQCALMHNTSSFMQGEGITNIHSVDSDTFSLWVHGLRKIPKWFTIWTDQRIYFLQISDYCICRCLVDYTYNQRSDQYFCFNHV